MNAVARGQIAESDVISFHNYGWPEKFAQRVHELEGYHRPLICTEYMARPMGSTFDTILPLGKQLHVAMINWGFVQGKSRRTFRGIAGSVRMWRSSRRCGSTMCSIRTGGRIASARRRFFGRRPGAVLAVRAHAPVARVTRFASFTHRRAVQCTDELQVLRFAQDDTASVTYQITY